MPTLPNPFEFAGGAEHPPVDKAVASAPRTPVHEGAAADPIDSPDIPLAELTRRGFDEAAFLNDIEPLPAFISAPSQEYLQAAEIIPVLKVLAGDTFLADIEPIRAAIARH